MGEYVLEVRHLTKYFGKVKALSDVNLAIERGKIYGLVGANGSGKSTFMNILFGNSVIEETGGYEGEILMEGEPLKIKSTKEAVSRGIGMIHQEFILIPEMSVAENIKLTRENKKEKFQKVFGSDLAYIDKKKNQEDAGNILDRLGFQIDSSYLVKNISVNAKQFVEIAREMDKSDLKLLFLDEPTAVLNAEDADKLMQILKEMAANGTSIVFCSHRLHEICEICDYVTVIRDGVVISSYDKENLTIANLASDMIGHEIQRTKRKKRSRKEDKILELKDFAVDMPGEMLQGIDLDIHRGEILGVTSLSGHGKLALGYGMMGMFPTKGTALFAGNTVQTANTLKNIENGIFLLPDDRKNMGLLLEHSIKENIVFSGFYGKKRFCKTLFGNIKIRDQKAMNRYVEEQIERLEIKCESPQQKTQELSGGNQQKVCIARAAAMEPEVLFVMEPTRGVDIGAKEKILDMLVEMNEERATTLVVASSELEELRRICDRIVVLCEGKVSAILSPEESEEKFALAYTGEEELDED